MSSCFCDHSSQLSGEIGAHNITLLPGTTHSSCTTINEQGVTVLMGWWQSATRGSRTLRSSPHLHPSNPDSIDPSIGGFYEKALRFETKQRIDSSHLIGSRGIRLPFNGMIYAYVNPKEVHTHRHTVNIIHTYICNIANWFPFSGYLVSSTQKQPRLLYFSSWILHYKWFGGSNQ